MSPAATAERVPASPERKGVTLAGMGDALQSVPSQAHACEAVLCRAVLTSSSEPVLAAAQRRWAARPVSERLHPLRQFRHWIAAHPETFARAISPDLNRSQADTLASEVLPLLDAIRFLERNARKLLAPRSLGGKHRPLWLAGVQAQVHRDPLGHVLVIGPANFPLFLPGAQTLQALAAGNAVTWKPGNGGQAVAMLFAHVLREAGLPRGILQVTGESVEAAQTALAGTPDKVVFTGSFETGRQILSTLAETATPATMELSGADAVVVLPSADLMLTAKAVAFGLRLNGAEVCMSPRRLIATRETLESLRPLLTAELAKVPAASLQSRTAGTLTRLLDEARAAGAQVHTSIAEAQAGTTGPIVVDGARPEMAITRSDLFAPVISLIEAPSVLHLAEMVNDNPFGLAVSIFGNAREAQTLAGQLRVGTVSINDIIAPTADPRIPFGGRGRSGYGITRGAEGLLEMTAAKVVLLRKKGLSQHYDPLRDHDMPMLAGFIGILHGASLGDRWRSVRQVIAAARNRKAR
ncbi:MAG TPA: aldehyde dehydrogenase family protein [Acidobacteriaceae bacterium]|nr:aldehyde dehydrogenase family protein [Acidobacteriaceae bacterium]